MKSFTLTLTILLVFLTFGVSHASYMRAEVSPEISPGKIEIGVPFTVDIYMNNDDFDTYGYSLPFILYSPDQSISTIIHRNVSAYSADDVPYVSSYNDSSIVMANGFDGYWNMINKWIGFSWDGSLPDSINHATATMGSWPSDLGEVLNVQFALQIDEPGTFCIDSADFPGTTYDWLFDFPMSFNGPYCWTIACEGDIDCDGIPDGEDNCPDMPNNNQVDSDGDDIGDVCDDCPNDFDNDIDNDGYCADEDNCPDIYNPDQNNPDGDDFGTLCDNCLDVSNDDQANSDGDSHGDLCDNCPDVTNENQADDDGDGIGNLCDDCPDDFDNDADSDGICGDIDNCPEIYNPDQNDPDSDDVGAVCDNCPNDYNPGQEDSDQNGVGDACEITNRTWYVKADGTGDMPTIQAAVDAAIDLDTVLVAAGTYTGDGNRDIDLLGKHLFIFTEDGKAETIIDCQGSEEENHRGFIIDGPMIGTSIIDGFSIENGYHEEGGGIYCSYEADIQIRNCIIRNNYAGQGGGIYVDGNLMGGIPVYIENCEILNNTALSSAGLSVTNNGIAYVKNCRIMYNIANLAGGLAVGGLSSGSFENCLIAYNQANGDPERANGGGCFFGEIGGSTLTNCTIVGNSAITGGSAVFAIAGATPQLINCIVVYNLGVETFTCVDDIMFNSNITLNCTDVYLNEGGDWVGIDGNFSDDPMFCDVGNNDFSIDLFSSCTPDNNECMELVGAFGVGCAEGGMKAMMGIGTVFAYMRNPIETSYIDIYLSGMHDEYSVLDINTSTISVNGSLTPTDLEYLTDPNIGDRLKITIDITEFIDTYPILWDTLTLDFTVAFQFNDETPHSVIGQVKARGHISGDVDLDGALSLLDATYLIRYLYRGGEAPLPEVDNGDLNGDGSVNLKDITYLLSYLYKDGQPPVPHE